MGNFGLIDIKLTRCVNQWCVFGHYTEGGEPIYFGVQKIEHVFNIKQFEIGEAWSDAVDAVNGHIIVSILSIHADEQAAKLALYNKLSSTIGGYRPSAMRDDMRGNGFIKWVQTGMYFVSASAAGNWCNITRGSISHHLNGRKGYETVHGQTFERVGTTLPHGTYYKDAKGVDKVYLASSPTDRPKPVTRKVK